MISILFYYPLHAVSVIQTNSKPASTSANVPVLSLTLKQIISLTPKEYKKITGKKMSFGQRLSLKFVQYKIKKQLSRNQVINLTEANTDIDATDFSFAGFLLGFLLSILGVLIAYLIGDRRKIKWSWYGFGFGALIILLLIII